MTHPDPTPTSTPPVGVTPDAHLAALRRDADARSARLAAELTVQMDWPHCPRHVIPLRDDATCGQCSPEPEACGQRDVDPDAGPWTCRRPVRHADECLPYRLATDLAGTG